MSDNERDRHHSVVLDCEWGGVRFECVAPVGASCRSLPRCQHHGGPCADTEGMHGGDCPRDFTPVDTGECVIATWINGGDQCGRGTLRVPVTTEWADDWWTWRPSRPEFGNPADALALAHRRGQLEALRRFATETTEDMAEAWGQGRKWLTTGSNVAALVKFWANEAADRIEADINEGSETDDA